MLTSPLVNQDSVKVCAECQGQGATLRTVRMGQMLQQVQRAGLHMSRL